MHMTLPHISKRTAVKWMAGVFTVSIFSLFHSASFAQEVNPVVSAERAFAALAMKENVRAAFIANMNDSSMVGGRGKLVKGLPIYLNQKPYTTGRLIWEPKFTAMAASGDMGFNSGPYSLRVNGKTVGYGDFATIWLKQPDGSWKFLLDLGNSHPAPSSTPDAMPLTNLSVAVKSHKAKPFSSIDKSFTEQVSQDPASAYAKAMATGARLLRPKQLPILASQNLKEVLAGS